MAASPSSSYVSELGAGSVAARIAELEQELARR